MAACQDPEVLLKSPNTEAAALLAVAVAAGLASVLGGSSPMDTQLLDYLSEVSSSVGEAFSNISPSADGITIDLDGVDVGSVAASVTTAATTAAEGISKSGELEGLNEISIDEVEAIIAQESTVGTFGSAAVGDALKNVINSDTIQRFMKILKSLR